MIFDSPDELKARIEATTGRQIRGRPVVFEDTSEYMSVTYGHVIRAGGADYFVLGETCEGRFGISEQPKFWVKRAVELETGRAKIIKLNFYEQFATQKGPVKIKAFRSPDKEAEILDLVRGHANFMQGFSVDDAKGNRLRIVDFIHGTTLFNKVLSDPHPHEGYFHTVLPGLMRELLTAFRAMAFLSAKGQHHGDIRNDHILIERETGAYRWIDFDLAVNFSDYDLWSLGNILVYATAKGIVTGKMLAETPDDYPLARGTVSSDDMLLYYPYRIANLRKVYPYIHPALNRVLVRFSADTSGLYEAYEPLIADLEEAAALWPQSNRE